MDNVYDDRRLEFGETYEDFEAEDFRRLIVATGEWLEKLLLDDSAVDKTMKTLLSAATGNEMQDRCDASWRELWDHLDGHEFDLRSAQYAVSLNAFAFFGLPPDAGLLDIPADESVPTDETVKAFVAAGRALVDAVPPGWASVAELARTVSAAESRLALDTGSDVNVEQLAAIARVNTKSIRNMLTPKGGTPDLALNASGEIPSADALRWLSRRPDFRSSIWRGEIQPRPAIEAGDQEDLVDVIFVPVAKDGSRFDPLSCRRGYGYTIGAKGNERHVADYRDALQQVLRMRTPRWRRPNDDGKWGIVAGVSWQRLVVNDLQTGEAAS